MSTVVVVPHDPEWATMFAAEAKAIETALGEALVAIHHIGSTSIPGIFAKPVMDILLEVLSLDDLDKRTSAMIELGYEAKGEFGLMGRRYFRKDDERGVRTHQVHSYQVGSEEINRHLGFRDHMRRNADAAAAYSDLKRSLAAKFPDDADSYIAGKDAFIRNIDRIVADSRP